MEERYAPLLRITVSWECAACGDQRETETFHQFANAELDADRICRRPIGWNVVNGNALCPKHPVEIGK